MNLILRTLEADDGMINFIAFIAHASLKLNHLDI